MEFFDNLWEVLGLTTMMHEEVQSSGTGEYVSSDPEIEQMFKKEERATYHPTEVKPKQYIYRPQTLNEYIGQERAKDLVRLNLQKIRQIKPVHFIISGFPGCGKTTLANVIAKELGYKIISHIGGAFTIEALQDFLIMNNNDTVNQYILFVDEIHNLPKELAEFMYPILEDFIYPLATDPEKNKVMPFIFMGATTEKNTLIKKFKPLVDRCGCDVVLEPYTPENIKTILKQYNEKIHEATISEEDYDVLSRNTRYTPRVSISMFDDLLVCKDLKRVLNAHRIIKNGLTDVDIRVLEHLEEIGKPVGEQALAIISGQVTEDYRMLIEPFIMQEGLITRTSRGRMITERGKELLRGLNA